MSGGMDVVAFWGILLVFFGGAGLILWGRDVCLSFGQQEDGMRKQEGPLYAGFEESAQGLLLRRLERERIEQAVATGCDPWAREAVVVAAREVQTQTRPVDANAAFARFIERAAQLPAPVGVMQVVAMNPIAKVEAFEDPAIHVFWDTKLYANLRVLSAVCEGRALTFPHDKVMGRDCSLFPAQAYAYVRDVVLTRLSLGGFAWFHPRDAVDAVARTVRVMDRACAWVPALACQRKGAVAETLARMEARRTTGAWGEVLAAGARVLAAVG